MEDVADPASLRGLDLLDADGQRLGPINEVYLDDVTGRPKWATVDTGAPDGKDTFVPLELADLDDDAVRIGFSAEQVRNAPRLDDENGHLDPPAEAELYRYYDLTFTDTVAGDVSGGSAPEMPSDVASHETDSAMTVSEERLRVATRQVPYAKARLRKYVVTEEETVVVPVRREKAILEVVPVNEQGEEVGEAVPVEGVEEVVLTEERVTVHKEVVPVERVRIAKRVEEHEETVTEEVRRERIEVEGDVEVLGDGPGTHSR